MALGSNFTNPQRVINKSFDAYIKGGNDIVNKVAKTSGEVQKQILAEKKFQAQMDEQENTEMQSMYSKINQVGSTGDALLDENMLSFWNDKTDEYFRIKNAMQKGTIGKQEGNQALSRINGLVGQFKGQAKYIAEQTAGWKEDQKNNNVSSIGSAENKAFMNSVGTGANTGIVERGGKLYYFTPGYTDENGNEVPDSMINGAEMMAAAANGEGLYRQKANISKGLETAFNETYQPDQMNSEFVMSVNKKRGDWIDDNDHSKGKHENIPEGEMYTFQIIDEKGKTDGMEAMRTNGVLEPLLNNDYNMQSYWQDTIPDEWLKEKGYKGDIINSRWNDFPSDMSKAEQQKQAQLQRDIAKEYMVESAYNDNATMDNKLSFLKSSKIPEKKYDKPKGLELSAENRLVAQTRGKDYASVIEDVKELYKDNGVDNLENIPTKEEYAAILTKYSGTSHFVNKETGNIQTDKKIVPYAKSAEEASRYINELQGIDREMQNYFGQHSTVNGQGELTVEDYLNG